MKYLLQAYASQSSRSSSFFSFKLVPEQVSQLRWNDGNLTECFCIALEFPNKRLSYSSAKVLLRLASFVERVQRCNTVELPSLPAIHDPTDTCFV